VKTQIITNSRLRTFHACQRLHLIQYVDGYRPNGTTEALAFGDLMHVGLEAWWLTWAAIEGTCDAPLSAAQLAMMAKGADPVMLAKAQVLMVAYDLRWSASMGALEVLAVEAQFETPLVHPLSGRAIRGARRAGKLDAIVRRRDDGSVWMVEHKTTGGDISPTSSYWQKLRLEPQVSMYFAGARALGYQLDGCIYDVIRRPDEKPLSATPEDRRKYLKGTTTLYKGQRETDETLEEYQARLATSIGEDPNAYFARSEVVRLPEELRAFELDVYAASRQMLAAGRTIAGMHAPRNVDSCFRFGRPCEFFDHCSLGVPLEDKTRFHKVDNVHPELSANAKAR
jgi:hypothetical protein